jgi:sugar/nucleoside kinase (ribokinase family)
MRALTVGETMALVDPVGDGSTYRLRIGGAESNFAVALTRLGAEVTWISRLGDDGFGDLVARTLAREGVDVRVTRDSERPTGVYFKWRSGGKTQMLYYRAGSAASLLAPEDVRDDALDRVDLVHLTGITTALGPGARALVHRLAARARARGITVLLDPNYRPVLWASPDDAVAALPEADWVLCGLEEGRLLYGTDGPEALAEAIGTNVAIRVGEQGALVSEGGGLVEVAPTRLEDVVDEVGAGDGFAAGFAYGLLQGWPPARCANAGNVVASGALRGGGDWETYPRYADVEGLL